MKIAVMIMGAILALGGAAFISFGAPIIEVERGWTHSFSGFAEAAKAPAGSIAGRWRLHS